MVQHGGSVEEHAAEELDSQQGEHERGQTQQRADPKQRLYCLCDDLGSATKALAHLNARSQNIHFSATP